MGCKGDDSSRKTKQQLHVKHAVTLGHDIKMATKSPRHSCKSSAGQSCTAGSQQLALLTHQSDQPAQAYRAQC